VTLVDLRDARYEGSHATAELAGDTEPPDLCLLWVNRPFLFVPNHKMVEVKVRPFFVDENGPPISRIVRVTSNEPENGTGDGDTGPDFEITGPLKVKLRAERSGRGTGRIYTIVVETSDQVGNSREDEVTVHVPK